MEDKPCTSKEANKLHQGETSKLRESTLRRGGKNCCVPQCKNNSRRNPELSFHKIPKDSTSKKKMACATLVPITKYVQLIFKEGKRPIKTIFQQYWLQAHIKGQGEL